MISVDYEVPRRGLGTDFTESERPLTFAKALTNRFININGGAEKRRGIEQLGADVSGAPNLTRIHEYVDKTGTETLFASDDDGNIYKYDSSAQTYSTVLTGKSPVRMISVQQDDKLIFVNGTDRNFYTDDAGATFKELEAIIHRGATGTGTTTTVLNDSNITSWTDSTQVAVNDIVFNSSVSAYGVITAVSAEDITHTTIGTAGQGSGNAASNQTTGQDFRIIDAVDLNVIPVSNGFDNTALAGSGTTTTVVAVSGVDFSTTDIRVGDFIRNTTQSAITKITAVSADVNVKSISGQSAGDSLVFLKSAMPIATWVHVHYGRTYYIDSRDQSKVRISAPDDAEDLTTFAQTLDSSTVDSGSLQPQGDALIAIGTYQKYLVLAGKKYVYVYTGVTPIQDTSDTTVSFSPVATYPQGCVSRFSLVNTGNDLLFISPDGLLNASVGSDSSNLVNSNVSDTVKNAVRNLINNTAEDNIQLAFYPRRNWIVMKIGSTIYNFNNTPVTDSTGNLVAGGSWSIFDNQFARLNHYFVRRNGDLIGCGSEGKVYKCDGNQYHDAGNVYSTELEHGWLRMEEPSRSKRVKDVKYIKPAFESGGNIVYSINITGGFENIANETITVSARGGGVIGQYTIGTDEIGGTGVQTNKQALRARGEEFKLNITTESSAGPDVITGYTMYGNVYGRR
jgi:hypothetical protein